MLIYNLQFSYARFVSCTLKAFTVQSLIIVADCNREVGSVLADLQQIHQDLAIIDIVDLEDAGLEPSKLQFC